ncbi:hypothetical protein ACI797_26610 [Geodermatophilus sp. SYSU D00691]
MTDPAGSDRIQQDVPTASGSGDNSDSGSGSSFEDVPLTREEAVERDAASPDEQPARGGSDLSTAQRAEPDPA